MREITRGLFDNNISKIASVIVEIQEQAYLQIRNKIWLARDRYRNCEATSRTVPTKKFSVVNYFYSAGLCRILLLFFPFFQYVTGKFQTQQNYAHFRSWNLESVKKKKKKKF